MFVRYFKFGGYASHARRSERGSHAVFWAFLLAVALAETVTSLVDPIAGAACHLGTLAGLLLYGTLAAREEERRLFIALTMAPFIRLLSLSLPLATFPQVAWYPMVSIPLLVGVFYMVRQIGVTRAQLGLVRGKLSLQLALAGGGLGIGVLEYAILRPHSMLGGQDLAEAAVAALSLTIFTGFNEELIFRGLLQSLAAPVMRRLGPVYVSLLFGVLHIGYLSVLDVVFVSAVGLVFAYAVRWGRSILGVTLAHGLTNITLFILMPNVMQQAPGGISTAFYWMAAAATALSLAAFVQLRHQAARNEREAAGALPAPAAGEDYRPTMSGLAVPLNGDGR
jgi:membrane protease YdiL (CAAX protease family)